MRDTIETARKALGISSDDCFLVPPHRHAEITEQMAQQFTTLYREPLKTIWWWEHLKEPCRSISVPDPVSVVAGLLEPNERYWFLAEAWEGQKKESAFWLYEMSGRVVPLILRETHHFEY